VALRNAFLILAAAAASLMPARPLASATQEFQVVVNASVRGTWISRASLTAVFTGKTDRWGDKAVAKPVDQSAKSPVRRAFTVAVLGLSLGEVQRYWQDRVASDRVFPPPIKSSDDEVLRFVAATPGAVGYVAAETSIPENVRVIAVVD
jgi:ABC-type phosphate transport system substrate-binding protein